MSAHPTNDAPAAKPRNTDARGGPNAALTGKTVLVTGAGRRIGAALARRFHAAGANVVLHYRTSADDVAKLARELDEIRPGTTVLAQADILDPSCLVPLAKAAAEAFGQLDVLVNNASTFYPTPIGEITESHWNDLVGTNLKAPLFLSQAAAAALRLTRGLILNIADIHGIRPLRRYTTYSVAKAGLIMLTKSLARELAPHVRVNAIAPGPVMWPEEGTDKELQRKIIDRTLLKRSGSADDVARAALFFATEAPYVTGQILAVDGGRSVGW
jgi:pteridine reductase